MHPYRHAGIDTETDLDREEIAAFASLQRGARFRAVAGAMSFFVMVLGATGLYAYWFYAGLRGLFYDL